MRTKIVFLLMSALITSSVFAKGTEKVVLEVLAKGKYSNQTTEVFQDGKGWACKTELMPYYLSPKKSFSDETLKLFEKKTAVIKTACEEPVTVVDKRAAQAKRYTGCRNEEPFRTLLSELSKNCGRQ